MFKLVVKNRSRENGVVVEEGRQGGAGRLGLLLDVVVPLLSCAWLVFTWSMGEHLALFGYSLLVVYDMRRLYASMKGAKFNNLGEGWRKGVGVNAVVFDGACFVAVVSSICGLVVISVGVVNWGLLSHVADVLFWSCLVSFALATFFCAFLWANYGRADLAVS
jgi:hypothetical protein